MKSDTTQTYTAKVDNPFEIELRSRAMSGYTWSPAFDERVLSLLQKRSIPASSKSMGVAGREVFWFLPRVRGDHEICFTLSRPWEKAPVERTQVCIHVD